MKGSRIITILFLLCCYILSPGSNEGLALYNAVRDGNTPKTEAGFSIETPHLYTSPFKTENVFDSPGSQTSVVPKSKWNCFWSYFQVREAFWVRAIHLYLWRSKTIFIGLETTDIIFPFHHFL